jgi:Domain of unknown function (DUF4157)
MAEEIPEYILVKLRRLVGQRGIPFDGSDIDRAKYNSNSSLIDKPLRAETYGEDQDAITHGDLIIFSEKKWKDAVDGNTCGSLALWAHELVHVFQNRRDGRDEFFRRYVSDARKYQYADIPYEKEAYAVQGLVAADYCNLLLQ